MKFKSSKNQHIGRSKGKNPTICKKHPKHKQSPGVCAICLREKLTKLSTSSRKNTRKYSNVSSCSSSSLSYLSSYSSSNTSSCASPWHGSCIPRGSSSSMAFLRSGKNVFTKCKSSMAFFMQRQVEVMNHGIKKKGGFLSKLLRPRSNMHEGLMESRTVRGRVTTRVH